ncbi:GNAT family N-acetyltransferase [Prosthecomicrobium sp. N25]|uniref:GNAT family N-acetyltransferase n=1 Tax=Prosthecomicrobium sp. N25 TaxID=3129254 RepID=UPI003077457B
MRVRPARADDVPALAAIAEAAYGEAFAGILEPETLAGYDRAFFEGRFAAGLASLTVAEAGGTVTGFAKTTAGHLDMLFVAPGLQGTGAGSALLADAEARGVGTLDCFRDNLPARRFYERRGWRLARSYEREFAGRSRAFVFYEKGRPTPSRAEA